MACALARAKFEVVLIEAQPPVTVWERGSYDLRVSAITRASQAMLMNLEVWGDIASERATPYRRMHVWDQAGFGEIEFTAMDVGEPDLGHIVENRVTQRALWRCCRSAPELCLISPGVVEGLAASGSGMRLRLSSGVQIRADLVIAADGARSKMRDLAGIEVQGWAYDQHALVATVKPASGHNETAWQHFMPTGPLALLPLHDDLFSIVWSTSPQHAEELLAAEPDAFGRGLTEASEGRVGAMALQGPRAVFPLHLQRTMNYVKPGIALVGDAAHVIHPLAGQGVNLGLLDAATLVDILVDARRTGRAFGGQATLRRYERARKGDNLLMQFTMDFFKRLFSNDIFPLKAARNLGLGAVDRVTPLKRLLAQTALGSGEGMPSLTRYPH